MSLYKATTSLQRTQYFNEQTRVVVSHGPCKTDISAATHMQLFELKVNSCHSKRTTPADGFLESRYCQRRTQHASLAPAPLCAAPFPFSAVKVMALWSPPALAAFSSEESQRQMETPAARMAQRKTLAPGFSRQALRQVMGKVSLASHPLVICCLHAVRCPLHGSTHPGGLAVLRQDQCWPLLSMNQAGLQPVVRAGRFIPLLLLIQYCWCGWYQVKRQCSEPLQCTTAFTSHAQRTCHPLNGSQWLAT